MSFPGARISDIHTCPLAFPAPVSGPVSKGKVTVLVGGLPAARVGDTAVCMGAPDPIIKGSMSVMIGGLPAARMTDMTSHGGMIILGCFTVLIGDQMGAAGGGVGASVGGGGAGGGSTNLFHTGPVQGLSTQANTLLAASQSSAFFCEECQKDDQKEGD